MMLKIRLTMRTRFSVNRKRNYYNSKTIVLVVEK